MAGDSYCSANSDSGLFKSYGLFIVQTPTAEQTANVLSSLFFTSLTISGHIRMAEEFGKAKPSTFRAVTIIDVETLNDVRIVMNDLQSFDKV